MREKQLKLKKKWLAPTKAGWHWTHSSLVLLMCKKSSASVGKSKEGKHRGAYLHKCRYNKQIIATRRRITNPRGLRGKRRNVLSMSDIESQKLALALVGIMSVDCEFKFGPHPYTRNSFFVKHQPLWHYPGSLKFEWSCVQSNSF